MRTWLDVVVCSGRMREQVLCLCVWFHLQSRNELGGKKDMFVKFECHWDKNAYLRCCARSPVANMATYSTLPHHALHCVYQSLPSKIHNIYYNIMSHRRRQPNYE